MCYIISVTFAICVMSTQFQGCRGRVRYSNFLPADLTNTNVGTRPCPYSTGQQKFLVQLAEDDEHFMPAPPPNF